MGRKYNTADVIITNEFTKLLDTAEKTLNLIDMLFNDREKFIKLIPEWRNMNMNQHNPYHHLTIEKHTESALIYALMQDYDAITMLAILFHDIGKPYSYEIDVEYGKMRYRFKNHAQISANITETILKRLGFYDDVIEKTVRLIKDHSVRIELDSYFIGKFADKLGEEQFNRFLCLREADVWGQIPERFQERFDKICRICELYNEYKAKEKTEQV